MRLAPVPVKDNACGVSLVVPGSTALGIPLPGGSTRRHRLRVGLPKTAAPVVSRGLDGLVALECGGGHVARLRPKACWTRMVSPAAAEVPAQAHESGSGTLQRRASAPTLARNAFSSPPGAVSASRIAKDQICKAAGQRDADYRTGAGKDAIFLRRVNKG